MNIFWLDADLKTSATYHCDKHVVKMILEYAQLLSSAHHYHDSVNKELVYKKTHVNHPCAIWTRATYKSYSTIFDLLNHLLDEYEYRYGRVHKTKGIIKYLSLNPCPVGNNPPIPLCMPDEYKTRSVVKSYRAYYRGGKKQIAKWTRRPKPTWFN